ncbi:MAG: hypothetical protein PQ975_09720 [Methanobacterium sp.]|jgi:hypothetical protein
MSKMLDVIMAGVISGIAAFTTSKIGIGGTVLGAVLGAMLYQFLSHFIKEPLESVKIKKIEARVVYIIPLIIIMAIEIIYILSAVYWKSEQIFYFLENATDWNLFRLIGIGLILMGTYPLLISENIKRSYSYITLSAGVVVLLKGLLDANLSLVDLYAPIFVEFGFIISLGVLTALLYVILSVIQESVVINRDEVEKGSRIS